ncbi:hypothetical protein ACFQS7_05910 [Dankookia sp. GCM10030260]|uniref:hypothetical protein n=1 Tax=Dankookia sp. GCM10030260 TaxID=3273390 RepID=UPI00360C1A87
MPVLDGTAGTDTLRGTADHDQIHGDGLDGPYAAIFPGPAGGPAPLGNLIVAGADDDTVLADTGFTDATQLQVRSVIAGADTRMEIHLPGSGSLGVDAVITLLGQRHLTAQDVIFA